jgi:hypothetical protein
VSQIFGWVPTDAAGPSRDVAAGMAAALRVDEGQRIGVWTPPGMAIGVIEPPAMSDDTDDRAPARSADGRFLLWMAGEAYVSGDAALPLENAAASRTQAFRRALLERWLHTGVDVVRGLDGEYQIAVWDERDRVLTLINDRFGGLTWYWAQSPSGFAFAGGVRGVLMAPGVRRDPDLDALREAVTFGGFRLADRTNVTSVRMVAGATVQTIRSGTGRQTPDRPRSIRPDTQWRPRQPRDSGGSGARAVVDIDYVRRTRLRRWRVRGARGGGRWRVLGISGAVRRRLARRSYGAYSVDRRADRTRRPDASGIASAPACQVRHQRVRLHRRRGERPDVRRDYIGRGRYAGASVLRRFNQPSLRSGDRSRSRAR